MNRDILLIEPNYRNKDAENPISMKHLERMRMSSSN